MAASPTVPPAGAPARPLAVLVHGMGRTPLSMLHLSYALRRAGADTALFGYSATFERHDACVARLRRFIDTRCAARPQAPCVLIGHSLGGVLLRGALPALAHPPVALFLLASPTVACRLARRMAPLLPYRLITGEMGQRLADTAFMAALPQPACPTVVYAGTAGPVGRLMPLGEETNDGILRLSETRLPGAAVVEVAGLHTFLMNNGTLVRDLCARVHALAASPGATATPAS